MSVLRAFRAKYSPILKMRTLRPKKATDDTRRKRRIVGASYPVKVVFTVRFGARSRRVRSNQYVKGIARPTAWPQPGRIERGNSTPQNAATAIVDAARHRRDT